MKLNLKNVAIGALFVANMISVGAQEAHTANHESQNKNNKEIKANSLKSEANEVGNYLSEFVSASKLKEVKGAENAEKFFDEFDKSFRENYSENGNFENVLEMVYSEEKNEIENLSVIIQAADTAAKVEVSRDGSYEVAYGKFSEVNGEFTAGVSEGKTFSIPKKGM